MSRFVHRIIIAENLRMNSFKKPLAFWAFLVPALVACGGGGGGGGVGASSGASSSSSGIDPANLPDYWYVSAQEARQAVSGSQAPTRTSSQALREIGAIENAADALLASDLLRIEGPSPIPARIPLTCSGGTCTATVDGRTVSVSLDDPDEGTPYFQVVMTHNGIPIGQTFDRTDVGTSDQSDTRAYGGWLQYSAFAIEVSYFPGITSEPGTIDVLGGSYSYGSSPGTNPVSSMDRTATWRGAMVGLGYGNFHPGEPFHGEAMVTVDFTNMDLDVTFSDIVNLHSPSDTPLNGSQWTWENLQINNGAFVQGSSANRIEGRFYGPNHEEVGGIFDRNEMVGAFGARRGTQ